MKLKPLTQWVCDSCEQIIEQPKHGWVEWTRSDEVDHDIRITHILKFAPDGRDCQGGPRGGSFHLHDLTGPDGLVKLLSKFDKGCMFEPSEPNIAVSELTELVRRLHVPHYEEARMYFNQATKDGMLAGVNELYVFSQENLLAVIEQYQDTSELQPV